MKRIKNYFFNLLILLDQVANTILGGYPDETMSLRSALARDQGKRWGCIACRALNYIIAPNHCTNTEIDERVSIRQREL